MNTYIDNKRTKESYYNNDDFPRTSFEGKIVILKISSK